MAPTVMAEGAFPGDEIPPKPTWPLVGFVPKLPADDTTVMPARTAASTACTSGSLAAGSKMGWPSDRLMTRMLYCARLAMAHWMADTTLLVVPWPRLLSTRRPIRCASPATPWNDWA